MSCTFGPDVCQAFMKRNRVDLLVRAHEAVDGFKFHQQKRVVTVFSAPSYCNFMTNAGAMMVVEKSLRFSFVIIRPLNKSS